MKVVDVDICDAIGQLHRSMPASEARIVSLVPSVTELLCDLGLAASIVGRTGFCIHPADIVHRIPKVGGTKDVNIEKIRALSPTHLIVNIDENEKPTVDRLAQFIPNVVVTHPNAPQDNLSLYRLLGDIFQVPSAADRLIRQFRQALSAMPEVTHPQKVLYCIWKDPWMTVSADTYIANMLRLIAWEVWVPEKNTNRYPVFDWSADLSAQIDRVLLSTEPYRFTQAHVNELEQQIGKPVQLIDGEMISWYGSRAIQGVRYLAGLATMG